MASPGIKKIQTVDFGPKLTTSFYKKSKSGIKQFRIIKTCYLCKIGMTIGYIKQLIFFLEIKKTKFFMKNNLYFDNCSLLLYNVFNIQVPL